MTNEDVAGTLERCRERVDGLATEDGAFVVACRETGVRPTPVTGSRFETYAEAERAAEAARRYRETLRSVDPDLESYDLTVCERERSPVAVAGVRERIDDRRANGLPVAAETATVTGDRSDEWIRFENAPVVHLQGPDAPLDDEFVGRQIGVKLDR